MNSQELSLKYQIPQDELEALANIADNPAMVEAAIKLSQKSGTYNYKFAKKLIRSLNSYYQLALASGIDLYAKGEDNEVEL